MAKLVVLVGLPASGKTTFAKHLAKTRGYSVVSRDFYIECAADVMRADYDDAFAAVDHAAIDRNVAAYFADLIRLQRDVVVDLTNLTVKSRAKWLHRLPPHYCSGAVVFCAPQCVLEHRLASRKGKTVPADVLAKMRERFVRPSKAEGFEFIIDKPNE